MPNLADSIACKYSKIDQKISSVSSDILNNEERLSPALIINTYMKRLREMGFITIAGRIRAKKLIKHAISTCRESENQQIQAALVCNNHTSFLQSMFYNQSRKYNYSTLKHVIIISSLFDSFSDFLKATNQCESLKLEEIQSKPRSQKSIVAVSDNKILKLFEKLKSVRAVASAVKKSHNYVLKVLKQHSAKIQRKPSKIDDSLERSVILKLIKGISTREIAKKFKISVGAVEKILSQNRELVKVRKLMRFICKREDCRSSLLKVLKKHRDWSRQQIKKTIGSQYVWLFKHDKDWFYENLPLAIERSKRKSH
ncbi:TnsD family Tn7-like transposition protein [Aliikangiella sp. IMCC44632]